MSSMVRLIASMVVAAGIPGCAFPISLPHSEHAAEHGASGGEFLVLERRATMVALDEISPCPKVHELILWESEWTTAFDVSAVLGTPVSPLPPDDSPHAPTKLIRRLRTTGALPPVSDWRRFQRSKEDGRYEFPSTEGTWELRFDAEAAGVRVSCPKLGLQFERQVVVGEHLPLWDVPNRRLLIPLGRMDARLPRYLQVWDYGRDTLLICDLAAVPRSTRRVG